MGRLGDVAGNVLSALMNNERGLMYNHELTLRSFLRAMSAVEICSEFSIIVPCSFWPWNLPAYLAASLHLQKDRGVS